MGKIWIVEIRVKDWRPDLVGGPHGSRVLTYEEVHGAGDQIAARHMGFDQFVQSSDDMLNKHGLTLADCCAPDAVEICGSL